MSKEEVIRIMYEGLKNDMKFMYQNAGLSEDDVNTHLIQGEGAFLYLYTNAVDRLVEKEVLKF